MVGRRLALPILQPKPWPRLPLGRPVMRALIRIVSGIWFLFVVALLNYLLLRYLLNDMSWHVRQTKIVQQVLGQAGFSLLPRIACPRNLAVVVTSAAGNFDERAAIRDGWGQDVAAAEDEGLFFIVGKPEAATSGRVIQSLLNSESAQHGDIIQADFSDTYRNLTLKSAFLIKWAYMYCSPSRFLFKADDDTFVNVAKLRRLLKPYAHRRHRARPFVAGSMPRLEPIRDTESKWYLPPSVYARTSLPRYVLGAGYVVSASAVRPLFQAALETPFFYLEDIFLTGLVAEKAGVEVIHTSYLMTMNDSDAGLCKLLGTVSAHPLTPDKQRTIWRRLRNDSATSGCPSPK